MQRISKKKWLYPYFLYSSETAWRERAKRLSINEVQLILCRIYFFIFLVYYTRALIGRHFWAAVFSYWISYEGKFGWCIFCDENIQEIEKQTSKNIAISIVWTTQYCLIVYRNFSSKDRIIWRQISKNASQFEKTCKPFYVFKCSSYNFLYISTALLHT